MAIIKTNALTKSYGKIQAVRSIDLNIEKGEIFGLLGPNGAGKTTTIGMLCTIIRPTSGSASIAGYNVIKEPAQVRRKVGIVFQDPPWIPFLPDAKISNFTRVSTASFPMFGKKE